MRQEALEAMARALKSPEFEPESIPETTLDEAEDALDALLDYLEANTDEWAEATESPLTGGGDALELLSVLREVPR